MRRKDLFLILAVIIVPFFLYFLYIYFIKLNSIECNSQFGNCNKIIYRDLDKSVDKNLLTAKKEIKHSLTANPYVENFRIRFKAPAGYLVELIEKKPKFALTNESRAWFVLVDDNKDVLELTDKTNLPVLVINNEAPEVGSRVDESLHWQLDLLDGLYYTFQIKSASLREDSIITEVENMEVLFPLEGERDVLIGGLMVVLNKIGSKDDELGVGDKRVGIDMRFINPVVYPLGNL